MPKQKNMQGYTQFKDSSCPNRVSVWKNKTNKKTQRSEVSPGEMQEVKGREVHHTTQSLQVEIMKTRTAFWKIKWPTAAPKNAGQVFD